MKNKSVSQHAFSLVPSISKPRSVFNRSHGYKTTFNADYLIPFYFSDVLPGDTVNLRHSILMRCAQPFFKPIMDNLHVDWFYFFVPYRLVWTNFVKFMGEQNSPGDSISYTIPQCTGPNVAAGGIAVESLHDYLGLPIGALSGGGGTTGITFNNLVPRSYNKIYMDWFKDENLQSSVTLDLGDGPDTYSNYNLLKRGKRFDYFTSCLPALQKGSAVTLPLGTSAIVKGDGNPVYMYNGTGDRTLQGSTGDTILHLSSAAASSSNMFWGKYNDSTFTGLVADLTTATAATINSLRQSIALQQFLENDARGGTRYIELIKQRWGVTSPDGRLQRSELLSIGSAPFKVTAAVDTAGVSGVSAGVGDLTAFGSGIEVGNGFSKSFTEHGTIIGLIMVRGDQTYQQGMDRSWSYRTRYDMFNPEFANLGEQAVLNKEIFANVPDGTSSGQKDGVFGYQERYAEYRYSRSMITGILRSDAASSIDVWHLSEDFSGLPTLGSTFIQSTTPVSRVVNLLTGPQFILDAFFEEKWARIMPTFSVPGLLKL